MKLTLVTKVRAKHFNYQNLQISQNKSKLTQTKKRWLGLGFPGLNTFLLELQFNEVNNDHQCEG